MGRARNEDSAFLNIPYDIRFEPLYLAFIAGLSGFGLIPRATLEIPGSRRRLDRIIELVQSCSFSFHDLSRVGSGLPRFNMPFELGLTVALANRNARSHNWFVFEAREHRLQQTLSDLDGTQVYVHKGRPLNVLYQLTNALVRTTHQPTIKELQLIYEDLTRKSIELKRSQPIKSLFEARPFRELVLIAGYSAKQQVVSLR